MPLPGAMTLLYRFRLESNFLKLGDVMRMNGLAVILMIVFSAIANAQEGYYQGPGPYGPISIATRGTQQIVISTCIYYGGICADASAVATKVSTNTYSSLKNIGYLTCKKLQY